MSFGGITETCSVANYSDGSCHLEAHTINKYNLTDEEFPLIVKNNIITTSSTNAEFSVVFNFTNLGSSGKINFSNNIIKTTRA